MIGIVGILILLPIALAGLMVGAVRFGANLVRALVEAGFARSGDRLAFHR